MAATVTSESNHFAIQATVNFTGLSKLPTSSDHTLKGSFGDWRVEATIPKATAVDSAEGNGLAVFLHPEGIGARLGGVTGIEASISLESLKGEVHATREFNYPLASTPLGHGYGFSKLADWNQFWHKNANHQADDGFSMRISIRSVSIRPRDLDPTALNTISRLTRGDVYYDTKFLLFSRPHSAHGAQDPLPVYASSEFLQSQGDYFLTMFSDTDYMESNLVSLDALPDTQCIDEYDYSSDSDLGVFSEDEGEDEDEDDYTTESFEEGSKNGSDFFEPMKESNEVAEGTSDQNVSMSEQDAKGLDSKPKLLDDIEMESQNGRPHQNCGRKGRVITVKDIAYVTWRAMIFYLSTSEISFAPLSSHLKSRARSVIERGKCMPLRPSAKSMYRLADKLGLDDLCKLSLEHIKSQLSVDIIVEELFSAFTSRHKAVRDVELAFLLEHWDELKNSSQMDDMVDKVTNNELPHASEVLKAILSHLKQGV